MHQQKNVEKLTDENLAMLSLTDSDSFEELIRRYEAKLKRYIRRLLNVNDQDVEDILQDAFIKAYRNLNSFDVKMKFSNWIYRITHNEAISHYRKNKKEKGNISIDDEEKKYITDTFEDSLDIHQELESKEKSQEMFSMILSLPEKYKDVIILHYFEDKSYEEISDILKKPAGTIATLINRAKAQLKKMAIKNNVIS